MPDNIYYREVVSLIVEPAAAELKLAWKPVCGLLYATARGPAVVEFNCRFGDPRPAVPCWSLRSANWFHAAATGKLADFSASCGGVTVRPYSGTGVRKLILPVGDVVVGSEAEGVLARRNHAARRWRDHSLPGGRVPSVVGTGNRSTRTRV